MDAFPLPWSLWEASEANVLAYVSWEWGGRQGEGMDFLVQGHFFGLVGFRFCHYCELQHHVIRAKGCKTRHDRPFVICELR